MRRQSVYFALSGVLGAILCFSAPAFADQAPSIHYELIGRSNGLTTKTITAVYQDRSGLIWIGSRDGLRVYDGYSYRLFDHDQTTPDSISDNGIRTIFEDTRGRLWIGTNTAGLELLDRATGKFTHFRHSSSDAQTVSHDSVYAIVEDRDGSLWVGTQMGLNHFDVEKRRFERILADPQHPQGLTNDYVAALHLDDKGSLWIGTVGGGLCRRDSKGNFTSFRHDDKNTNTISSDRVFAIAEDSPGHVWVGTEQGVSELDPAKNVWRRFDHFGIRKEDSGNIITSLAWTRKGNLLVGSFEGLYEMETTSGQISKQEWIDPSGGSAQAARIIALLTDVAGDEWVGTWGSGLVHGRPGVALFGVISVSPEGLSARDITAIFSDRTGKLWVGTTAGGLDRRDAGAASFHHYDAPGLGGSVISIYGAKDGTTWFGTYDFLGRIDSSGKFKKLVHDPSNPASLSGGYVTAILQDGLGQLWVGTGGGGINRLRPGSESFEHFSYSASDPNTPSDDYVTVLYESSSGTLWVGTRSGGLNECDRQQLRCRRYLPKSEHAIGHHYVTSIFEDSAGRLWVGTAGGGLNLLRSADNESRQFVQYTTNDGLPDNNVTSIAEDEGHLWLGTRHGLVLFNPSNHQAIQYSLNDGLPAEEFNHSAVARDKDSLYFGTPSGMLTIKRGERLEAPRGSPTVITSVRSLNNTALSDLPVAIDRAVSVPYGTVLSIEAAVLDYSEPGADRYQYRMSTVSDRWIDLGNRRAMTFTDLSPGTYRLDVRGRNQRGIWSSAQPLEIHIIPRFWMRNSFRALVVLLAAALFFALHRRRTTALIKRNQQLLDMQAERERALEEARSSEQALQVAYERLQTLTRRIEAVAEEERRHIAHELHDEMGQMLTAAKINLQLLASQTMQEPHLDRVTDTVQLVDTMISRVRALSLDLRPPLLYELGLMPALRAYVEGQARRSGLEISMEMPDKQLGITGEVEIAVFRIVQETVTNAIRHANASRVDILLTLIDGNLRLEVRDDGTGFDIGEVNSRAAMGEGHHGLAGIRERALLLGGETMVSSGEKGVAITVNIPIVTAQEATCS